MTRRARGTGTAIKQRPNGLWYAAITEAGYRRWFYGSTQAEVLDKLKAAQRNIDRGARAIPDRITVASYLADWLDGATPSLRLASVQRYEQIIRVHINPALGKRQLSQLAPPDLRAFYAGRIKAGLSPATVHMIHAVLHRALDTAARDGTIPRNVAALVSPPRLTRTPLTTLTAAQTQALLDGVRGDRYEALWTLAATTGMRQGELLALRWQDIDLAAGTVEVRGSLKPDAAGKLVVAEQKTSASRRTLALSELALSALQRHRSAHPGIGSAFVFTDDAGRPLRRSALCITYWYPLLERLGLPRVRFHDLRHGIATLLVSNGVAVNAVSAMLGHSLISTTLNVYVGRPDALRQTTKTAVDALLKAPDVVPDVAPGAPESGQSDTG